ncbi:MAG: ABC transporter substrate-binding protein [Geobacteraceae bacterium]|nr:ABC transporter substrate-binding protein [Geobacteraceae bacterium]
MNMAGKKKGVTPVQPPSARPAYSDDTLAEVMRSGRDTSGRILDTIMPRYLLEDKDMSILIAYLKNLAYEYSPGIDNYNINFATIITDEVHVDQVEAMMKLLESFVTSANKQQVDYEAQLVKLRETRREPTYRRVKLSRWLLKGPPGTWQSQLETYYRKEPVFALIGGITSKSWKPVHEFSEAHMLPCILPITDFPVVSATDWYTLYFSKGYFQEGEAAASFLASQDQDIKSKKIVQIVRNTPQGQALSEGFMQGLNDKVVPLPSTIMVAPNESLDGESLKRLLDKEKPDILALWTDDSLLRAFMEDSVPIELPATLLISSGYFGSKIWSIPEKMRSAAYITYPYRLPQDESRYDRLFTSTMKQPNSDEIRRIKSKTMASLRVLTQALKEMRGDFFRDYLFDTISMMQDLELPLYERLSFGPEQRYASKGCYVVQLSKGEKPDLIKKSDWVIH